MRAPARSVAAHSIPGPAVLSAMGNLLFTCPREETVAIVERCAARSLQQHPASTTCAPSTHDHTTKPALPRWPPPQFWRFFTCSVSRLVNPHTIPPYNMKPDLERLHQQQLKTQTESCCSAAGFNCLIPCLGESVAGILSLRVQQLDVRCETKTADNVSWLN